METVFHKLFHHKNGKKSSRQLGLFCRKNRQATSVIELPTKDLQSQYKEDDAIFVAMPPADVRLVLFQEFGETSDRRLLFNSKSYDLQKKSPSEEMLTGQLQHSSINNNSKVYVNTNNKPTYQYVRGPQDSEILSEMLFGTVGMASRASSLKIHLMKEPQRLMLSRVFCVESSKETVSLDRGIESQRLPIPVLSRRKAKTLPVPTPEPSYLPPPPVPQSLASSLTSRLTRSDSSSSLLSLTSILGASLGATGSLGSRSQPQQIPTNRAHSLPPATRQTSRDSFTLTQEPHRLSSRRTKVKIGFAVIFQPEPTNTSAFQRFFFEHFPLIESYLTLLKEQVESALNNCKQSRQDFVENMMEALNVFTLRVNSIYSTPRLPKPVWTTLTRVTSKRLPWQGDDITMKCFIADLARMVSQNNTRHRNFFMTGLVTSVLSHHLAWVNTMMPPCGENDAKKAYNPLWVQLGDLYGAVGTPTKVAKTVVLGEIHELVSTIISILSYFIRCSDVSEVVDVPADMTPQAFIQDKNFKMSLVPSDLENDYVYISTEDDDFKMHNDASTQNKDIKPQKPGKKFSLCSKSKPIENKNSDSKKIDAPPSSGITPSPSSSLCRSRSSPGSAPKPPLRVSRQKSSGYVENLPAMRVRTNSNDAFAKPRGVQSRRTSHDVPTVMSKSASALAIPPSEQNIDTVHSLEGSMSLCNGPTPVLDSVRKRLNNEKIGSCPNVKGQNEGSDCAVGELQKAEKSLNPAPAVRPRTHKRVSSEPFSIKNLRGNVEIMTSTSLVKTNSIYSPVVRQTFVDAIEPRVVNVAHVQRSRPVVAMCSPVSSPQLPRSKSSVGQKGPILGFKTSEISETPKMRVKHKSGSFLQENSSISESNKNIEGSPSKNTQIVDTDNKENSVRRSSSNLSQGGAVRRNSSSNSGKIKLAGRRRRLSSKNSSFDDDKVTGLPPLQRIPSVSMEHENFAEYFDEDDEKSEYITFSTHGTTLESLDQSSETQDHSTMKEKSVTCDNQTQSNNRVPPPLPTLGPCHATITENHSTVKEVQSCMELISKKAEKNSSVSKGPPPLPSVGPCHRSLSSKWINSTEPFSKLPPPVPTVPPVVGVSLYPKLDLETSNFDSDLPKSSLYPSLCENSRNDVKYTGVYPKLDDVPDSGRSLYPKLPTLPSRYEIPKHTFLSQDVSKASLNIPTEISVPENAKDSSVLKKVPLQPVIQRTENYNKRSTTKNDEELHKLNFGDLIADYSPDYQWGFALHGTQNHPRVYNDIIQELQHSVSRPVLDEPVAEAVTIVADTDKWSVKVLSSHRINSGKTALPAMNSKLIHNILERITKLYQMNVPAKFCMQQLESSLGELVLKSRMLAGYVVGNTRVPVTQLSAVLGIESTDLPLLMAIASCHSPQVAAMHTMM